MKRFILIFTAVMFLANSFAVSAWAKPCVDMDAMQVSAQSTSMTYVVDMSDMPCHEDTEQKSLTKHCDGVCLCVHASINQTPVLSNDIALNAPVNYTERLFDKSEMIVTVATVPLLRPPIHHS